MPSARFLFLALRLGLFQAGLGMLRQLYFGSLDMELHAQYDPSGDETPFDVQKRVADHTLDIARFIEGRHHDGEARVGVHRLG